MNAVSNHQTNEMERIVAGFATKSDKIRALARAGYRRSEIARYLGISYQHARNVLVDDERLGRSERGAGFAESSARSSGRRDPVSARMEQNGRVTIPQAFREALGLKENDSLILTLEDDGIRLMSLPASVKRAQALVRSIVPEGVSLVDELLSERRKEADDEGGRG